MTEKMTSFRLAEARQRAYDGEATRQDMTNLADWVWELVEKAAELSGQATSEGRPGSQPVNCEVCGFPADLDDDGLCEDCAVDGWGDDDEPARPMEDVPTRGLL